MGSKEELEKATVLAIRRQGKRKRDSDKDIFKNKYYHPYVTRAEKKALRIPSVSERKKSLDDRAKSQWENYEFLESIKTRASAPFVARREAAKANSKERMSEPVRYLKRQAYAPFKPTVESFKRRLGVEHQKAYTSSVGGVRGRRYRELMDDGMGHHRSTITADKEYASEMQMAQRLDAVRQAKKQALKGQVLKAASGLIKTYVSSILDKWKKFAWYDIAFGWVEQLHWWIQIFLMNLYAIFSTFTKSFTFTRKDWIYLIVLDLFLIFLIFLIFSLIFMVIEIVVSPLKVLKYIFNIISLVF